MEEIYQITAALRHLSWGKQVAVLTDARFSGVSTGACIGHVGPEALAGGPIGALRDGDTIQIVVDRNRLEGSVDLVGEGDTRFGPEQGARVLAARPPRPDLAPDPDIPADTRLWAALQQAGGGTWGAACTTWSDRPRARARPMIGAVGRVRPTSWAGRRQPCRSGIQPRPSGGAAGLRGRRPAAGRWQRSAGMHRRAYDRIVGHASPSATHRWNIRTRRRRADPA
jgi:hypothetical protein